MTPSTAKQLEAEDTTSPRRKVGNHKAQKGPTESFHSTLQRTGATTVCDGRREENTDANAMLHNIAMQQIPSHPPRHDDNSHEDTGDDEGHDTAAEDFGDTANPAEEWYD